MKFRGVFLTSAQPEVTARFYRDVARVAMEEVGTADTYRYWKCDDGHAAFLEYLRTQRIEPIAVDAIVVTLVDPDGRMVLFGTA